MGANTDIHAAQMPTNATVEHVPKNSKGTSTRDPFFSVLCFEGTSHDQLEQPQDALLVKYTDRSGRANVCYALQAEPIFSWCSHK